MAAPAYQISRKSTHRFKFISGGHTDRQAGDLISPLSFFESRLKTVTLPYSIFKSTQYIKIDNAVILIERTLLM
jgi:hypothetical protein